jgi:hypothetical protein
MAWVFVAYPSERLFADVATEVHPAITFDVRAGFRIASCCHVEPPRQQYRWRMPRSVQYSACWADAAGFSSTGRRIVNENEQRLASEPFPLHFAGHRLPYLHAASRSNKVRVCWRWSAVCSPTVTHPSEVLQ